MTSQTISFEAVLEDLIAARSSASQLITVLENRKEEILIGEKPQLAPENLPTTIKEPTTCVTETKEITSCSCGYKIMSAGMVLSAIGANGYDKKQKWTKMCFNITDKKGGTHNLVIKGGSEITICVDRDAFSDECLGKLFAQYGKLVTIEDEEVIVSVAIDNNTAAVVTTIIQLI